MPDPNVTPSELIDARIDQLDDWRGPVLAQLRELILQAVPGMVEEVKWVKPTNPLGVPTWYSDGLVCTGEVYKDKVKVTFAKGAALDDPDGIFNSSLEGKVRRAMDVFEGDKVNADAFKAMVFAHAELNAG